MTTIKTEYRIELLTNHAKRIAALNSKTPKWAVSGWYKQGKPNNEILKNFVEKMNKSNSEMPSQIIVENAIIVKNSTGEILASYSAPLFSAEW